LSAAAVAEQHLIVPRLRQWTTTEGRQWFGGGHGRPPPTGERGA